LGAFRIRTIRKSILFVAVVVAVSIISVSRIINRPRSSIALHYDDHKLMEKEIEKVIPIDSAATNARRIMEENYFICTTETASVLDCRREKSYWPTYEGTIWSVQFDVRKNKVSRIRVWIAPS